MVQNSLRKKQYNQTSYSNSNNNKSYSSNNKSTSRKSSKKTNSYTSNYTKKQKEQWQNAQNKAKAAAEIASMPDSKMPKKKKKGVDVWNNLYKTKISDEWGLKEEIFLYTYHDKEKHKYITSVNIDIDKTDILGTCQISAPYDEKLMEYWIPGKTVFSIIGGTFDREVLFTGMVAEVNQIGSEIEIIGNNIGWKFKPYMSSKFEKSLNGLKVKDAIKLIFKQLNLDKGYYHIDLRGIPDIDSYKIKDVIEIQKQGQTIQNAPELIDVVKNMNRGDLGNPTKNNRGLSPLSRSAVTNEVEQRRTVSSIKAFNGKKPYKKNDFRYINTVDVEYGKTELLYEPKIEELQGIEKIEDFFVKGYSGDGEHTYEDVLNNIATAIDAHFFIVGTKVIFVSFSQLVGALNKNITGGEVPRITYDLLEEDSFELDINQYGYYNTVEIQYKNGTIKKCYDELVSIFGEIKITYKEPNLDRDTAETKAYAYLIAHVRDFGMEAHVTTLYSGDIIPGMFVYVDNPLFITENPYFVHGAHISWSADNQTLIGDLDLRFGPENPDNLEVPEAGVSYSNKSGNVKSSAGANVSGNIRQAAEQITAGCTTEEEKAAAIFDWVDKYINYEYYSESRYSSETLLKNKRGNCWDTAYLIYKLCSATGVRCEVWNGYYTFTSGTQYGHIWNKLPNSQGTMVFADAGWSGRGKIGQHHGHIDSGSVMEKNY